MYRVIIKEDKINSTIGWFGPIMYEGNNYYIKDSINKFPYALNIDISNPTRDESQFMIQLPIQENSFYTNDQGGFFNYKIKDLYVSKCSSCKVKIPELKKT